MSLLLRRALHPLVLLAFTLLSAFHTWPLLGRLKGFVVGGREDVYMNMWHLWWLRQSLWVDPQNPYFAPVLHWPLGAELYWHTLSPAKTGWGLVLLPFMGPEVAYNLVLFGTFVATGYTAWLLLRYLLERGGLSPGISAAAALAGACVYTFSRYHFSHALAHLNLSALEGIPLYLWCFFRWLDGGGRRFLAGLALSALYVLLCDYYYLLYIALLSFIWIVAERWKRGPLLAVDTVRDPLMRRAALAALAAGVVCVPPLLPLLAHLNPAPLQIHHGDSDYYTDLYALFLPDLLSVWLEAFPARLQELIRGIVSSKMAGNLEESGVFIGWLTPVLAGFALWRGVPEGRRWAWMGVGFVLISMGTVLAIGGREAHSPAVLLLILTLVLAARPAFWGRSWRRDVLLLLVYVTALSFSSPLTAFGSPLEVPVPMPYVVFKHVVPLFKQGGMPVRFEMMTTLALAVLVAFGAAHVGTWVQKRWARLGVAAALLVAVIPNVEYRNQPMVMAPLPKLPPVFEQIRQDPYPSAVFTDHVVGQWEQIFHGQPVSFARLSRLPVREAGMVNQRLYRALEALHGVFGEVTPEEQRQMRDYLQQNHFRWYVAHFFHPARHQFVVEVLGGELVHRDATWTVYRFP